MDKHKDRPRELTEIEEAFRHAAESVRRGDPETLAGRMPKEWREQEAARLAAEKRKDRAQSKKKAWWQLGGRWGASLNT